LAGAITPSTKGFLAQPKDSKRMHCLVMCVPAPSASAEDTTKRVQELVKYAIERGESRLRCNQCQC
jgi:alpha/beta superfamily hydrolase